MKVLLLFANTSVKKERAFPDDLKNILDDAATKKGSDIEIFVSFSRSLSFFISNEKVVIRDHKNHRNLEEYDLVYFRKAGPAMQQMQACAHYLRDRGVPFYDLELIQANSRNKLSQMIMLERKGLPIPATLFCRNKTRLKRLVTKKYAEYFPFPIIVKATGGSRGDANYLVKNYEELDSIVRESSSRSFIIQQFIPNDGDYRFFIAGGNLYGAIHRRSGGDSHLSNTSKGGSAELVDISNFSRQVRSDAVLSAQIFGRSVAGVDIMIDSRNAKHYFLEVNRAPQVERSSFESEKGEWLISAFESTLAHHQAYKPAVKVADMDIMGRFEKVDIYNGDALAVNNVIAKIDTGADSSSIHADNITENDGQLHFTIDEHVFNTTHYFHKKVKSSNGVLQERYYVEIPVSIGKNKFLMKATLSDRKEMKNTMLIGRRFLRANRIVVDVSKRYVMSRQKTTSVNEEVVS